MKPTIFIILLVLFCITPVMAVTYPDEYYTLGNLNDKIIDEQNTISLIKWDLTGYSLNIGAFASLVSSRELRRQTILLEKQNEILSEGVKAQWVETCYRSIYSGSGNYSACKSECANAGYPVD